jgi:hypothetical protein
MWTRLFDVRTWRLQIYARDALVFRDSGPYMLGMQETLFKASQVAKWCGVDLKTVHNWVDKKQVEAGRTPGRHLRFTPATVHKLLSGIGASIPSEVMAAMPTPEQPSATP